MEEIETIILKIDWLKVMMLIPLVITVALCMGFMLAVLKVFAEHDSSERKLRDN